jgi:hypothetical protein
MMSDDHDYILEIGGREIHDETQADSGSTQRPYICVQFECCSVYSRIYKNREGTAYVGWCPKCAKKVTIKVGEGGVSNRFFKAQ